jgi:hypothetical protein
VEAQILVMLPRRVVVAKVVEPSIHSEGISYSEWCKDERNRAAAGRVSST